MLQDNKDRKFKNSKIEIGKKTVDLWAGTQPSKGLARVRLLILSIFVPKRSSKRFPNVD